MRFTTSAIPYASVATGYWYHLSVSVTLKRNLPGAKGIVAPIGAKMSMSCFFYRRLTEAGAAPLSQGFHLCPLSRAGNALVIGLSQSGMAAETAKELVARRWSKNWETNVGTEA